MEPVVVLIVLPMAIGAAAHALLRTPSKSSLAAALAAPLAVFVCVEVSDPGGSWNWLATLLVSPLVIAFSVAIVCWLAGRRRARDAS